MRGRPRLNPAPAADDMDAKVTLGARVTKRDRLRLLTLASRLSIARGQRLTDGDAIHWLLELGEREIERSGK